MPISEYLRALRAVVGSQLLILPSVAVAVFDGDRALVGLHEDMNRWVFPGGAVDPGEAPVDAAVREVWEETGLEVELTGLVGAFGGGDRHRIRYPNGDVCDYVTTVFTAAARGGRLDDAREELTEFAWLGVPEIRRLDVMPWMREVLDAIEGSMDLRATWRPS